MDRDLAGEHGFVRERVYWNLGDLREMVAYAKGFSDDCRVTVGGGRITVYNKP